MEGSGIGTSPDSPRCLIVAGKVFDYRGAHPDDWAKGTFTLREDTQPRQLALVITDCGVPKYNGKTTLAISSSRIRTLTITGNEPGNPAEPASFDAPGARRFVLKKE